MEKIKLPDLKVTSFITSLSDDELQRVRGGIAPVDATAAMCTTPVLQDCDETETACSSSDINHGVTCMDSCIQQP